MTTLRLATWNVHGAVGLDGKRSVERIADVLRDLAVDVAMLQELDVARPRSGGVDQPAAIAVRLGVSHVFGAAVRDGDAAYGNAIVSRWPLDRVETFPLPTARPAEPRAVTRAELDGPIGPVVLAVTHLGLVPSDRAHQMARLVEVLAARGAPRIVAGDFNATPGSALFRSLRQTGLERALARSTFPSFLPLLALDHVWTDAPLQAKAVEIPSFTRIRGASDHLPVVVTLAREAS